MTRKPADLSQDHRQLVWEALRKALAPISRADLHHRTGVAPSTVGNYLKALVAGGVVEKEDLDGGPFYRLVRDTGHHAPRLKADGSPVKSGHASANLWRSMRMMKQFAALELAAHSCTPDVEVTENMAKVYCSKLLAAGYLRVIRKAAPPKRAAIYRLIRDTGPKSPQIQRVQQVFDPNTRQVHAAGGAA